MTRLEIKESYLSQIKRKPTQNNSGGQTVGLISRTMILVLEELDIEVKIGYCRSQFQNYDAAKLVIGMLIDDYLDKMKL